MAEQKVKLTQLPEATDTINTAVLLVNQNETDQRLPVTHFLRAKNNLSELENTAQARANLGVPSIEDVNDKIEYLIDGKSTFLNGATLESERDFIWDDNSKCWYYWTGAFSKEVPAASTPESTGGIGAGKWLSVGDATNRRYIDDGFEHLYFIKKDYSFSLGFTVNNRNEIFNFDGVYFQYLGDIPFQVAPNTFPTKNINGGDWLDVGDGSNKAFFGYLSAWCEENENITDVVTGLLLAGKEVVVDRFYVMEQVRLESKTKIRGLNRFSCGINLVAPSVDVSNGETANLYFPPGWGFLSDVEVSNLTIDGGRSPNPTNQYHHCIGFWVDDGDYVSNVRIKDVSFKNAGEDFIRFVAKSNSLLIEDIFISGCSFETDENKINLAGYSSESSGNALRTITSYTPYAEYGVKTIRNVNVINCYARRIRTLSDFKRGTFSSISSQCNTEDMYDCHLSMDGAFDIIFSDISMYTNMNFSGGTATNFIEIQGEHVVCNNVVGSGSDITKQGVLVTDYGLQEEGGKGHNSVGVTLSNIKINNVMSDGIKVQNGISCNVNNVNIKGCKGHSVLFTSGVGRNGDDGNPLKGYFNSYDNINGSGWAYPPKCQGEGFVRGRVINSQGQDDIYIPGAILRIAYGEYGSFSNKSSVENLVSNNHLEFTAGSASNIKWFVNNRTYEEVISAPSVPDGEPMAVTISDQSTTALREIYHPPFIAKYNDIFYLRVWALKGTANNFSIAVQEFDSGKAQLGSTIFYNINMTGITTWKELVMKHLVINTSTRYVMFGLIPAGGSNAPINTGTTHVSNLRIGRSPFGIK